MSKKVLNVLATLFALPAAFLLILVVIPWAWSIISGGPYSSGWGEIGKYLLVAIACGIISILLQRAGDRVEAPPQRIAIAPTPSVTSSSRERALYMSALRSSLVESDADSRLAGGALWATDGMLHSYESKEIDWEALWRSAANNQRGIPPYGERPYWTPTGPGGRWTPHSVLAFWGTESRLRVANDPRTDELFLKMIFEDPDARVRSAAAARL